MMWALPFLFVTAAFAFIIFFCFAFQFIDTFSELKSGFKYYLCALIFFYCLLTIISIIAKGSGE